MAKSEWNVETLKEDIKKYTARRDELVATIQKMEEAKIKADEILRHIPDEDNPWKQRYLEKQEENIRRQKELNDFIRPRGLDKIETIENPAQVEASDSSTPTLQNMSDLALQQLQRKLEKDRTEMEWKLKEYGWRLDQASAALCRAKEEKQDILTQIGHAVVKLKDVQLQKVGGITKSQSQ